MKRTLIVFIFTLSTFAQAGVNLIIEHPRHPNQQLDKYKVNCDKKCVLEIDALNPEKGYGDSKFNSQVKSLWSVPLPKEVNIRDHKVLYKVTAIDGDKKIEFKIGYSDIYSGEELVKYLNVIQYIETLKRTMRSELEAGKK